MTGKRSWFFEEVVCTALLFVIFSSVVLQVVNRWLFKISLPWTEELARYSFVWLSCIGISLGVKQKKHMDVDLIGQYLREKSKRRLEIVVDVVFIILCLFIIYYGLRYVGKLKRYGQKSAALHLQAWVVYLAGPVGLGLSLFRIVQKNIAIFRRGSMQ
jgi:TRAP-type C4-dicarboxylate transport system permease small subunit